MVESHYLSWEVGGDSGRKHDLGTKEVKVGCGPAFCLVHGTRGLDFLGVGNSNRCLNRIVDGTNELWNNLDTGLIKSWHVDWIYVVSTF